MLQSSSRARALACTSSCLHGRLRVHALHRREHRAHGRTDHGRLRVRPRDAVLSRRIDPKCSARLFCACPSPARVPARLRSSREDRRLRESTPGALRRLVYLSRNQVRNPRETGARDTTPRAEAAAATEMADDVGLVLHVAGLLPFPAAARAFGPEVGELRAIDQRQIRWCLTGF